MSLVETAAGFVLAGGQSRRMGSDKALLELAGRPLIARAVETLRVAGLTAAIAATREDLQEYAPVVADHLAARGPLSGVCAALESTTSRWGVFITVDTPLLPAELLSEMLHDAQVKGAAVTVAIVGSEPQTFPVVLDRAVLPILKMDLEAGRWKCSSAFEAAAQSQGQAINLVSVETAEWFLNVNAPEDLRRAESLLRVRDKLELKTDD